MSHIEAYFESVRPLHVLNQDRDNGTLLNGSGAAVVAGVSRERISKLAQSGKLPSIEVLYGVVFHRDDVIAMFPDGPGAKAMQVDNFHTGYVISNWRVWWKENKPARRGPKTGE